MGRTVKEKLKKKPVKKDPSFGSVFGKSALQGFAKLIKQGHSTAEAIKIMEASKKEKGQTT